jgi:bifunctional DNA-binding transcriptional regulator/antitoxin component of YhaV-PrlF toxin-antitoxin module
MAGTTAVATVLSDGRLSLPSEVRASLGLRKGCRLELTVHRVLPTQDEVESALVAAVQDHQTTVKQLGALAERLKSCREPSSSLLRELEGLARSAMSEGKQRRLRELLAKQGAGGVSVRERQLVDKLVEEGQVQTVRKANAALVLKWLGVDLFPELSARRASQ